MHKTWCSVHLQDKRPRCQYKALQDARPTKKLGAPQPTGLPSCLEVILLARL